MSGTYQSRAFNFINGQTNRVKNSLNEGWRQVKISVKWTGQILLAPLRWLNRFSQDTNRQIAGKKKSNSLPGKFSTSVSALTTIDGGDRNNVVHHGSRSNQAIETLLAEVAVAGYGLLPSASLPLVTQDDWSIIDENEWNTAYLDESNRALAGESHPLLPPQPELPIIQGLATLLSNQHLVLIDQQNQVLDILSPSQQLHIRQRISPAIQQALRPVTEQLETTHSALPSTPPIVFLAPIPAMPRTILQKLGYWSKYYLEYFNVDIGRATDQDLVSAQPLVFQSPLHKSLAVIPHSIAPLPPEEEFSPSSPPAGHNSQPRNNSEDILIDIPKTLATSTAIDINSIKSKSKVTFQPEWIEAPTETLGYEKSLFGQLWLWLDRLMLKIENWIITIYQRLKKIG